MFSATAKKYPWLLVGLLWVVAMLNYLDRQMLSTMKPAMQQDIPELQSATNFGFLMAIFLWIYGFMSPVSGMVADRLNRKWLITGSLLVWSAVTLAMGYATNFEQLYFLRALMGVSEALYIPAALSMISDFHSSKTRSLAVGIHMTGFYMGQALGGFGATIAHRFSWPAAFHGFGWFGIAYAVLLAFFLKDKTAAERNRSPHAGESNISVAVGPSLAFLFSQVAFRAILFFFTVSSLPGWAVKNWLPTLFAGNLDIPMSSAGPISTISIAASSLLGVIFGGTLSDKWVQKNLRGRIYTSAIGLSLTIPALLLMGSGNSLFHIIGAAVCFGFGFGMFDANNMPILCQFLPSRLRATAYGVLNMCGVFAGAAITNLLGKSTDAGHLGRDFSLMAVVVVAALLVQLYFLKPKTAELER